MVVVAVPVGPVSSTSKKLWVTIPTFNQDSSVGPGGAIVGLGDKPSNAVDSWKKRIYLLSIGMSGYQWDTWIPWVLGYYGYKLFWILAKGQLISDLFLIS